MPDRGNANDLFIDDIGLLYSLFARSLPDFVFRSIELGENFLFNLR